MLTKAFLNGWSWIYTTGCAWCVEWAFRHQRSLMFTTDLISTRSVWKTICDTEFDLDGKMSKKIQECPPSSPILDYRIQEFWNSHGGLRNLGSNQPTIHPNKITNWSFSWRIRETLGITTTKYPSFPFLMEDFMWWTGVWRPPLYPQVYRLFFVVLASGK